MFTDINISNFSFWENNRKIAWLEGGDPEGFPLFYAHGNPGSRLELLFMDKTAKQYGLRLIVFDRPGIGKSDYIEGYPLLEFARDLVRMADDKGFKKFGLIGWSSGGPPVLATAYHSPDRVQFAFAIASYTNFGEYIEALWLMKQYRLYGLKLSEKSPGLFKKFTKSVGKTDLQLLNLPSFYLKIAKKVINLVDRKKMDDSAIVDMIAYGQDDSYSSSIKGAIQSLKNLSEYIGALWLLDQYRLYGPKVLEKSPRLLKELAGIMRQTEFCLPNLSDCYLKIARGVMHLVDRQIMQDPELSDLFLRSQEEALSSGIRGAVQDLQTQLAPWEFSLKKIKVPVHIFQGKLDVFVPWQFAKHLASNIPGAILHMYKDRGHLYPLRSDYQHEFFGLARSFIDNPKR